MSRICYVCGHEIADNEPYYSVGHHTYTCSNQECFEFYYWDSLAARMVHNKYHEYAIINGTVYAIGSDMDEPRGFNGQQFTIEFNDGTIRTTNSLWLKGELPERLRTNFKDNARFITTNARKP